MSIDQEKIEKIIDMVFDPNSRKLVDISIGGHEFNIDKPIVTKEEGNITVDGTKDEANISHRLAWRKDDQVYYKFTVRLGQSNISLDDVDTDIAEGGFIATYVPIVRLVLELYEDIKDILATIEEKLEEDSESPIGKDTVAIMSIPSVDSKMKNLLDGSWRGVAGYIILSIALAATVKTLALQKPDWFDVGRDLSTTSTINTTAEIRVVR